MEAGFKKVVSVALNAEMKAEIEKQLEELEIDKELVTVLTGGELETEIL